MGDPWDIPPLPLRGDADADETYKMVGRAISGWEEVEYHLSHLYAQFLGKTADIATMRQYGEPRIFSDRAAKLEMAATAFFARQPSQQAEGRLSTLMRQVRGFSDRRNEIAHSVVRALQWVHPPMPEYDPLRGETLEYGLVPPIYTDRKLDATNRPKYIYTANELTQFVLAFHELSVAALHLKLDIARGSQP